MKSFFFIVILFICISFSGGNESIRWDSKRPLTWDDFKGKPENGSPYKAMTMSEINIELKTEGDSIQFNVINTFIQNISWTKENNSDYLLKHEQLHFNITEIFARKLRKSIAKSGPYQVKTIQKKINEIRSKVFGESKEFQAKYDQETKHSEDKDMQKKWEKVITYELSFLEDWSSSAVSAKIKK